MPIISRSFALNFENLQINIPLNIQRLSTIKTIPISPSSWKLMTSIWFLPTTKILQENLVSLFLIQPPPPISKQTVDELTNDFKGVVMEIPNVTIAEKVKALVLTIDENRKQEVLDQLKKFADKHSLDFKLSFSSDKSLFYLEIYGDGFHIVGRLGNKDNILTTFYIDSNNEIPNPTPFPQETFDELFNDLKNFLEEIPNATVTEAG